MLLFCRLIPLLFTLVLIESCKSTNNRITETDSAVKEAESIKSPDLLQSFMDVLSMTQQVFKERACTCELLASRRSGVVTHRPLCSQMNPLVGNVKIAACNPQQLQLWTLILETPNEYFSLVYRQDFGYEVSFLTNEGSEPDKSTITKVSIPLIGSQVHSRKIPSIDPKIDGASRQLGSIMAQVGLASTEGVIRRLHFFYRAFEAHLGNELN